MSELEVGLLPSRLRRVVIALGLTALLVFLLDRFASTPALISALPALILVSVLGTVGWSMVRRRAVIRGPLSLDRASVRIGGRRVARRFLALRAFVVPDARDGTFVRLERALLPPLDLAVEDVAHGRRVLAALGLDAARAAAHFAVRAESRADYARRLRFTLTSMLSFGVFALVVAFATGSIVVLAWSLPIVLLLTSNLAVRAKVTVGTDGMAIRWKGTERFVPFEGIVDVDVVEGERIGGGIPVLVRLRDREGRAREEVLVDAKQRGLFSTILHASIVAQAEALAERIREAIAARRGAGDELDRRALARGGRETNAWVRELRAALEAKETFRSGAAPTPAALLRVLEDARARPVERVAAAIALSGAGDHARARIRVAAEATAAPQLRSALESAASEEDGTDLAKAIEAVEKL